MEQFISVETIFSFTGMVLVCGFVVQAIKNLSLLKSQHTYKVVITVSLILVGVRTLMEVQESAMVDVVLVLQSLISWIVNTLIVSLASMKGFESIKNKSLREKGDHTNPVAN